MASHNLRDINPSIFATLDADMWVAYYNHRFFRLFILLIELNYTHFGPDLILTIRGAYHSAMAAIVFRKTKGNEDADKVLRHLAKYYRLISGHNTYAFD